MLVYSTQREAKHAKPVYPRHWTQKYHLKVFANRKPNVHNIVRF